ncbi:hypothetical protein KY314_05205 [Candidatus Woesearchaeota archaeon]|nr:hypothetical protein [Candidatus Woesearchaeota archaeon]
MPTFDDLIGKKKKSFKEKLMNRVKSSYDKVKEYNKPENQEKRLQHAIKMQKQRNRLQNMRNTLERERVQYISNSPLSTGIGATQPTVIKAKKVKKKGNRKVIIIK